MDALKRIELGDFAVRLSERWAEQPKLHPASLGFSMVGAPFELVLTAERVAAGGRSREDVVETYVTGRILSSRRGALSAMAGGDLDEADVVGALRVETKDALVGARQWVHLGDHSIVVAAFAADAIGDRIPCFVIAVICNQAVDLDLDVERLASEVISSLEIAPQR
jgi:hypothetical protein